MHGFVSAPLRSQTSDTSFEIRINVAGLATGLRRNLRTGKRVHVHFDYIVKIIAFDGGTTIYPPSTASCLNLL